MIVIINFLNSIETWNILERSSAMWRGKTSSLRYTWFFRTSFTWYMLGFSQCQFDKKQKDKKHTKTPPHQFLLLPCRLQHSRLPPSSSDCWGTWDLSIVDNLESEILFSTPFCEYFRLRFLVFTEILSALPFCGTLLWTRAACGKMWDVMSHFFASLLVVSVLASLWAAL